MSRAAEIWRSMSEKDKQPYEKMHQDDVKRFEKETAEFKKKGWFTMQDGTKSTDLEVKKKKKAPG